MSTWISGFITGICIGIMAFIVLESNMQTPHSRFLQEAVERGFAEWRLTHAHNGTTEFRWLDKSSPPTPETVVPPKPADQ